MIKFEISFVIPAPLHDSRVHRNPNPCSSCPITEGLTKLWIFKNSCQIKVGRVKETLLHPCTKRQTLLPKPRARRTQTQRQGHLPSVAELKFLLQTFDVEETNTQFQLQRSLVCD